MGNCVSAPAEEREAKMRSSMIDKELRSAARDYGNTIKILLLGKPRLLLFCSVTFRQRQQEDAFDLLSSYLFSSDVTKNNNSKQARVCDKEQQQHAANVV